MSLIQSPGCTDLNTFLYNMSLAQAATQQPAGFPVCVGNSISLPKLPGINIDLVEANVVRNATGQLLPGLYLGHGGIDYSVDYCNVSVTYSHSDYPADPIHVHTYLPADDIWNGRMVSIGGGGFIGGLATFMAQSMEASASEGYAAIGTDAGHSHIEFDPKHWALKAPGEVDMHRLETFAYKAYGDMSLIGDAVLKEYYGRSPMKKYWNGCSTGGRQGLAAAQRYPDAYDGILAAAPAVNWAEFLTPLMWPQLVMDTQKTYPSACELEAIRAAAIEECDLLDGVRDGMISTAGECTFDPTTLIGMAINCSGKSTAISKTAADVAGAAWLPRKNDGDKLWYGISPDAVLVGMPALANTACDENGCHGVVFDPPAQWLKNFVAIDPDLDMTKLTYKEMEKMHQDSISEYHDLMSTSDPDLSAFQKAGGKMITYHGIADQVIPVKNMRDYYDRVREQDPNVYDYYRYFEAPGFWHCFVGPVFFPTEVLNDLTDWV